MSAADTAARIIPAGAAIAVGRFRPEGVLGYRAAGVEGAPLRATRVEALEDWKQSNPLVCVHCGERTSSEVVGDTGAAIGPLCEGCQQWSSAVIVEPTC